MRYISPEIAEKILAAADILDIVSRYVQVKKKGGSFWGLSPFKTEQTPSFSVNPARGIFNCFASGLKGNAVKFVMEVEKLEWLAAMHRLAEMVGVEVPAQTEAQAERETQRQRLLRAVEWAKGFYTGHLRPGTEAGEEAMAWLMEERGMDPLTASTWSMGLAPDAWESLVRAALAGGFTEAELVDAGLAKVASTGKLIDLFRHRIMFPIADEQGRTVAFGGRTLSDDKSTPKYINSPETAIYRKSETLYGLDRARKAIMEQGFVVLVEGYTDVIQSHRYGVMNTVATCGTALTPEQARMMKRFTQDVLVVYDGDEAGIKAALRAIDVLLAEGMSVGAVILPDGHDPDSYLCKHPAKAYTDFITGNRQDWPLYVRDQVAREQDPNTPSGKAVITEALVDRIRRIPSELLQIEYMRDVATQMNVPEAIIEKMLRGKPADLFAEKRISFDAYLRFVQRLDLAPCPDFFRAPDGGIEIHYFEATGKRQQHRSANQAIDTVRFTSKYDAPNGIYIPPALREGGELAGEDGPEFLLFVEDELLAYALSEAGIPALGMARSDAFAQKPGGKKLHATAHAVLRRGYKRAVYLLNGRAFQLPHVERIADQALYTEVDAGQYGANAVDAMTRFTLALRPERTLPYVVHAREAEGIDTRAVRWLEMLMLSRRDWAKTIQQEIETALEGLEDSSIFGIREVTYSGRDELEQIVKIGSAQDFYNYHGFDRLGGQFNLGGSIYEVNLRTDEVSMMTREEEVQSVWMHEGRIWAQQQGSGIKAISNFVMACDLKITNGDDTYGIYSFTHYIRKGQQYHTILEASLFTERNRFFQRIKGIAGANLWWGGSTQNLIDVDLLLVQGNPPEAESLYGTLGYHAEMGVWVWGNGIMQPNGEFRPIDDRGLVEHDKRTYFLPAFSSIRTRTDHDSYYEPDILFEYAEGPVSYQNWIDQFRRVHGQNGHVGFCYVLMAMMRDIVVSYTKRCPHLFLLGEKGSGKGVLSDSISAMFGDIKQMNLNDEPTMPAYRRHFSQYSNVLTVFNEVNPSSVQPWMITGLKAPYDNQLRGKMDAGSGYKNIDYGRVTSAALLMGQETNIYLQEAVNSRCCIIEFPSAVRTQEEKDRLYELETMQRGGLGHITAMLFSKRAKVEEKFDTRRQKIERELVDMTPGSEAIDNRLFFNWACCIAPLVILIEDGMYYPNTVQEILVDAASQVAKHSREMVAKGILDIFFGEFIQTYWGDRTYGLNDNHVFHHKENGTIHIQLSHIYPRFERFLNSTHPGLENTTKGDMARRLGSHPACVPYAKGKPLNPNIQIGYKRQTNAAGITMIKLDAQGKPTPHRSSGFVFDAEKLGLDLTAFEFSFDNVEELAPY